MDEVITYLEKEKVKMGSILKYCEDWLKNAPEDNLRVSGNKKKQQYYRVDANTKKQIYIRKDEKELLCQLSQKKYLQQMNKMACTQKKAIEKFCKIYKEKILEIYTEKMDGNLRKYIQPLVLSDEEYASKWESEIEGEKNPIPNDTEYYSDKEEHVRSRVEMHIANKLHYLQIPYKYEPELVLDNGETKYPDFMILNKRTRKVYYWEHLGYLDDGDYLDRNLAKINSYERNGILLGKNLILTMETKMNPVNSKTIDKYIKEYLY